jgi:hypothetical protein
MNVDLNVIKVRHLKKIGTQENHIPLLSRTIRRYRILSTSRPQYVVIGYFISRAFPQGWSLMRAKLIEPMKLKFLKKFGLNSLAQDRHAEELISRVQQGIDDGLLTQEIIYGIRITGGLGDAIIVARLARDLQAELGEHAKFDVYFHSPQVIEPFFNGINGFRESIHIDAFQSVVPYYTFSFIANQYVTFVNEHINHRILLRNHPKILKLFGHSQAMRRDIEKYITAHPILDGAFSDLAVRQGHKRYTYLHHMLGIPYGGGRLNISVEPNACETFGLTPGSYITVHDGWDTKFALVVHRPTKVLALQAWVDIVRQLKIARPDLTIVQLGGKTGENIQGVDVNLKNKLSFVQSMAILADSALHLDTESGLVHIGVALGVKSVVMFGPTNVEWFGYPQNANIAPKQCGNCWWSTESWMDVCPTGHEKPVCLDKIDPQEVVSHALALLDSELIVKPIAEICALSIES